MTDQPTLTRRAWCAAFAACLTVAVPMPALAEPDWCQIDDPAAWSSARAALIAAGQTDLTRIDCPAQGAPEGLPPEIRLPMPCGRSMIFRRIDVPAATLLDQVDGRFGRVIDIDSETPQSRSVQQPVECACRGRVPAGQPGARPWL